MLRTTLTKSSQSIQRIPRLSHKLVYNVKHLNIHASGSRIHHDRNTNGSAMYEVVMRFKSSTPCTPSPSPSPSPAFSTQKPSPGSNSNLNPNNSTNNHNRKKNLPNGTFGNGGSSPTHQNGRSSSTEAWRRLKEDKDRHSNPAGGNNGRPDHSKIKQRIGRGNHNSNNKNNNNNNRQHQHRNKQNNNHGQNMQGRKKYTKLQNLEWRQNNNRPSQNQPMKGSNPDHSSIQNTSKFDNTNSPPIHPIEKLRESFMQSLQSDRERRQNQQQNSNQKNRSSRGGNDSFMRNVNNESSSKTMQNHRSNYNQNSSESKLDQLLRMSRLGTNDRNNNNNNNNNHFNGTTHTSGAKAFRERRKMQLRQQQQQQNQYPNSSTNYNFNNRNNKNNRNNNMIPNASRLRKELLQEEGVIQNNIDEQQKAGGDDDKTVLLPRKNMTIHEITTLFRVPKTTIQTTLKSLGESVPKHIFSKKNNSSNASDDARDDEYTIDTDLAELIALELGLDPQRAKRISCQLGDAERRMLRSGVDDDGSSNMIDEELMEKLPSRPPVVCIMGHVDHGKTTLMDSLRQRALEASNGGVTNQKNKKKSKKKKKKGKNVNDNEVQKVAGTEAGGITQTVSAFQVALPTDVFSSEELKNGGGGDKSVDKVTFLDTPGHAAFKAMRQSGSNCGDVIVLVIAADDGVSPQTVEIIDMYKSIAKSQPGSISLVVAMTKIDKPGVDLEESMMRIESQLMEHDIYSERMANSADYEYGGVQLIPVSGLTGEGLDDLIEGLALQSEIMDLRADNKARAEGLIIDSKMEKGLGVVADCIVRWGNLSLGDYVVSGVHGGRIRILNDVNNKAIKHASPSQPVRIIGLKTLPKAGDPIVCVQSEEIAKEIIKRREAQEAKESHRAESSGSLDVVISGGASKKGFMAQNVLKRYGLNDDSSGEEQDEDNAAIRIPVILKADADGTLAALRDTLLAIQDESKLNLCIDPISLGIGHVTTSDVTLAAESGAGIFCFNLKGSKDNSAISLAVSEGIEIRSHNVIYHLLDEAKEVFSTYCPPTAVEIVHGKATIKQVFDINNNSNSERVAGLMVEDGYFFLDKSSEDSGALHCNYRVTRGKEVISPAGGLRAKSLRRVKEEVISVRRGEECGVNLQDYFDINEGDIIECYSVEMKRKFV